jgi:3-oxoacyl-[acyl-carrier-protein] synthase-1
MRRVVVTGIGIVSSIGNDRWEVLESLRQGRSGLEFAEDYKEMGLRSHVRGPLRVDLGGADRPQNPAVHGRCGSAQLYRHARGHCRRSVAGSMVSNPRAGLVTGSGGGSPQTMVEAADLLRNKGLKAGRAVYGAAHHEQHHDRLSGDAVQDQGRQLQPQFRLRHQRPLHRPWRRADSVEQAGHVFVGGGEEVHWSLTHLFDAMGALVHQIQRDAANGFSPYDANRDGFVISGGGGLVVLEELEHAQRRGARIYAELVGLRRDFGRS